MDDESLEKNTSRAWQALNLKQYKVAIEYSQQVLAFDPYHYQALCVQAFAFYYLDKYTKALEIANQLVGSYPDDTQPYYIRSLIYQEMNERANAISDIHTALALSPDQDYLIYHLAHCLFLQDKNQEALDLTYQALAINPTYSPALYLQALLLETMHHKAAAEAVYNRLLHLEPEHSDALAHQVKVECENEHYGNAENLALSVLARNPSHDQTREQYIQILALKVPILGSLYSYYCQALKTFIDSLYYLAAAMIIPVFIISILNASMNFLATYVAFLIMAFIYSFDTEAWRKVIVRIHPRYSVYLTKEEKSTASDILFINSILWILLPIWLFQNSEHSMYFVGTMLLISFVSLARSKVTFLSPQLQILLWGIMAFALTLATGSIFLIFHLEPGDIPRELIIKSLQFMAFGGTILLALDQWLAYYFPQSSSEE